MSQSARDDSRTTVCLRGTRLLSRAVAGSVQKVLQKGKVMVIPV